MCEERGLLRLDWATEEVNSAENEAAKKISNLMFKVAVPVVVRALL